jgi:hypothetical protein
MASHDFLGSGVLFGSDIDEISGRRGPLLDMTSIRAIRSPIQPDCTCRMHVTISWV